MKQYPSSEEASSLSAVAINNLSDVSIKTLPNGLKLIAYPDNANRVLCLQLYIRTGSVKEKPGEEGYSHFIEHLCFKATREFPSNSISAYASSLGGLLNAFTDYDCTCYYILIPSEELMPALNVLSQLACHTCFTEADVAFEKDVILEEIKQYENDPEPDFIEYIQVNHFSKSPLKRPVLGSQASISEASFKSLRRFYDKHYTPQNCFLVISGDYIEQELYDGVENFFGNWANKRGLSRYRVRIEPEKVKFNTMFRKKAKGEEYLAFVLSELSEQHPMSDALLLAVRYLAIGKSSRLFKRLVEEEKLCSAVKVSSLSGVLSGASVILTCPIGRKNIARILYVFKDEFCRLLTHGIPPDDMHLIKQDVIHSWLYSFEGVENTANLLAAEEFNGSLHEYKTYGAKILALDMEDVFSVMRKYWQPNTVRIYHQGSKHLESVEHFKLSSDIGIITKPAFESYYAISNVPKPNTVTSNSSSRISQLADGYYAISLSNGMQVLLRQVSNKSVTGFALSSHTSQLCESDTQRGHNFFTSTMLLYGTQYHSHSELMRYSREYGFNIRAIHHIDSTTYRGKCQPDCLDKALYILSEIVQHPKFDKEHLQLLTSAALDGIRRDNDYPVSYAYHKWFEMLVGNKSNLFRSTGNPSDIRSIRMKDILAWYEKWDIARDFHLGIVGSHQPEEIAEMCDRLFTTNGSNKPYLSHNVYFSLSDKKKIKQYRETDQAIIHLGGYATPASLVEDNAAFHILAHILGGDISSRFFDILREQYGFAYQTGFDFSSVKELGFWNAYAFCDKHDYNKCIATMKEILTDIVYNGVTALELDNAKKYLVGMNRFDHESASYTASSMSNLAALGYSPEYYLNRESRIRAVSLERIHSIAAKWLNSDNHYLHILV